MAGEEEDGIDLLNLSVPLAQHWKLLLIGPLVAGLVALSITFLMPKIYTSRAVFLPPQQQSAAIAPLSQLGALSALAGTAAGVKTPADPCVALLQSETVTDRLVDEFKLIQMYETKYRFEARKELANNMRATVRKKDGLITIEVDDEDPQRAADVTAAEVKLQTLRRGLPESAPEVQQGVTALVALRAQVANLEASSDRSGGPAYGGKFREFKYQESLFELFARQYELVRVDESREWAPIQLVDVAKPVAWKSRPKRAFLS